MSTKLPNKIPPPDKEVAIVDLSFYEWMSQPKKPTTVWNYLRNAFHVGYYRGKMAERYPDTDNPD